MNDKYMGPLSPPAGASFARGGALRLSSPQILQNLKSGWKGRNNKVH